MFPNPLCIDVQDGRGQTEPGVACVSGLRIGEADSQHGVGQRIERHEPTAPGGGRQGPHVSARDREGLPRVRVLAGRDRCPPQTGTIRDNEPPSAAVRRHRCVVDALVNQPTTDERALTTDRDVMRLATGEARGDLTDVMTVIRTDVHDLLRAQRVGVPSRHDDGPGVQPRAEHPPGRTEAKGARPEPRLAPRCTLAHDLRARSSDRQ